MTDPIDRVTKRGIVTADGESARSTSLVCATGYQVFNRKCVPGYEIVGRGGKNLGEFWETNRFQAYEGATVAGLPQPLPLHGPVLDGRASPTSR